ncbi:L,D-transpeptidase [Paraburkholderia sp. G-4-1-8]|uniref:L,D-transpeptidase n=2 Tax=Paraburkholderia antibiotica TaxID=2728839 RepID=A0A7Y0A2U0_9BURK|nr:L,D-transpeptidase [Paraburkholderia antibiotica]
MRSLGVAICVWGGALIGGLAGVDASAAQVQAVKVAATSTLPSPASAPKKTSGSSAASATSKPASASKPAAVPNGVNRANRASGANHTNRPSAALDASAVAAPDAVGVVDPQRALLLRDVFARDVTRRLKVPVAEQRAYAERLEASLDAHELGNVSGEYVVLVDRNANVQALFIYFRAAPADTWQMIGASPVSTGRPGEYDHFITPLGVFDHTPDNMDFRSEGTQNENRIRGYGRRDMRIFDLGWAQGERGWGKGGISQMRLQMHATDPDRLEPLLGIRHSKGCVRMPASLNAFLDHYGILDAAYAQLVDSGKSLWVLKSDRQILPWAGRYIVVVDSQRKSRPAWSPAPGSAVRAQMPAHADTAD